MTKSTSLLLAAVVAFGMMASTASADITKGQRVYLKQCKTCHGNGTKGASMHTQAEWEALFANDGASIIAKHVGTAKEEWFKGPFKASAQDLRDFLFQYGKDSGNFPSCG